MEMWGCNYFGLRAQVSKNHILGQNLYVLQFLLPKSQAVLGPKTQLLSTWILVDSRREGPARAAAAAATATAAVRSLAKEASGGTTRFGVYGLGYYKKSKACPAALQPGALKVLFHLLPISLGNIS